MTLCPQKDLLDRRIEEICDLFDSIFYHDYQTRLRGGHPEPFYRAPTAEADGEIQFTRDYFRSALHETAHWCVAGEERLAQNDWGYWYAPDGRSKDEQQVFYQVEVKPQALEWIFCDTCQEDFSVSADNLDGSIQGLEEFESKVRQQKEDYLRHGLPKRAMRWVEGLQKNFAPTQGGHLS